MRNAPLDPQEQTFVEKALAAADRSQLLDRIRVIAATALAVAILAWFVSRPSSPQLGIETTICLVIGAMIALTTVKLRLLIQRNTRLILQAIDRISPRHDS
jgi:4-amino-4-deoxy-L-arabinose transferase-like glycosyltransferase